VEIFVYPFMTRALIAGIFIGLSCSLIGVFIVLRRMAFFSDAIAHTSLAGVAISLLLGANTIAIALLFSVTIALGIGYINKRTPLSIDTVIGIFFSGAMALAVIIISFISGYQPDLISYLFGNILAITGSDLILAVCIGTFTTGVILTLRKPYLFLTLDRDGARLAGMKTTILDYMFLALLALVVVASIRIVGVILVSALIIIPPATAKNVSRNFTQMIYLSMVFGVASVIGGLVLSYYINSPSGAVIVLFSLVIFIIAIIIKASTLIIRKRIT
jgi:ABC-type Mn2+/Zn2+ transport system permease subunit